MFTAPCDRRTAVKATVEELAAHPGELAGRCVTVEAWSNGTSLYASEQDLRVSDELRDWVKIGELFSTHGGSLRPA